ncbi:hypothetical protein JZX88_13175 [Agrobacterium sp. OT33]|nr:hypothetical protein [Agrobacterium sp. OT33]
MSDGHRANNHKPTSIAPPIFDGMAEALVTTTRMVSKNEAKLGSKGTSLRNFSIDGAKVVIATAQTGLIFGILWSRRMISFVLLQQRHDDRFF